METNPKKQRQHFYRDYASGQWSMSELCDRYQISRPTGYKCRPVFVSVAKLGGSVSLPIRAQNPARPYRSPGFSLPPIAAVPCRC